MKPTVLLSQQTEAFSKHASADPQSTEGRTPQLMHFITQATPKIPRKVQTFEAGPEAAFSALVEETFGSIKTETSWRRPIRIRG